MHSNLITVCVVCASAAMPAWAQSSVTLSGVVDLGIRQVHNEGVGSLSSVVSGSNATSRIIFSGREDLGEGLSAGFHLESGLLADTGVQASATKFFDRRSSISLTSKGMGELRVGRDLTATYANWGRYDPFAYIGAARSANFVSSTTTGPIRAAFGTNANTTVRSDNLVQYLLPSGLGGLEGGLMWAPSEGGDVTTGRAKLSGIRIGYADKVFNVSAATTHSHNNQTTAGKFKDTGIGGAVNISAVKITAAWRQFKYDQSKQSLLMVGAVTTFGAHEVKASWTKTDLSGRVGAVSIDANDATQLGLGYVFNFSKRTALYGTIARISNDGAARYVISDGPAGMASGGTSRGYEVGLRHRF